MKVVKRRGYIEVRCFDRIERRKKVNRKYNRRVKKDRNAESNEIIQ